ncbi:MAG: alpha/beta hydrolase fold domain-containing protein [Eubacteriales bacterium]
MRRALRSGDSLPARRRPYRHRRRIGLRKGFGALLAAQTNVSVLCIAYRLAPEHKFPAAQDDAMDAYQYLLDAGYKPEKIAIAGESARPCAESGAPAAGRGKAPPPASSRFRRGRI